MANEGKQRVEKRESTSLKKSNRGLYRHTGPVVNKKDNTAANKKRGGKQGEINEGT